MRYKKTLLIICLIACVLFSIASVVASDVNETTIANEDSAPIIGETDKVTLNTNAEEGILEKDDGTFSALKDKIDNAERGSTITLENDYKYNQGFDTGGIKIDKPLTIDGKGHTIDANSQSRIFILTGENIVLKNIKFINGHGDNGGAINAACSNCNINSCTFTSCNAENGGAIYARDVPNMNISNSKFTNNKGTQSYSNGGAIWITGDNVNIENNEFAGNIAVNGGAIYISSFTERRVVEANYVAGHYEYDYSITIYDYVQGMQVGSHHPKEWVPAHTEYKYGDVTIGNNVKITNNIFNRNSMDTSGNAIIDQGTNTEINDNLNYETSVYKSTIYVYKSKATNITNNKFDWEIKTQSGSQNQNSGGSSANDIKITAPDKTFNQKAKTKKYTVTIKSAKKPVKNLKVNLKIKGKTYVAKTNKKGKATFKITNLKKKGTYKATITYKINNKKVTKTAKIKCK